MDVQPPHERTLLCGITGSDQFAESLRQWRTVLGRVHNVVADEYQHTFHLAACDRAALLDRLARRHEAHPLLAAPSPWVALLMSALGLRHDTVVWNTYCSVPQGPSHATFSILERCAWALLEATYTIDAPAVGVGAAGLETPGVEVAYQATLYLWGWPRYAAPVLLPLLRGQVLRAVAQHVAV